MPKCQVIKKRHRRVCVGDLRDRVILKDRVIREPQFGQRDFTEDFDGDSTVAAMVETVSGKTLFDGVNQQDVPITHEVIVRYDPSVNNEGWVEFEERNLKVIQFEDLDERHQFIKLFCQERGPATKGAAKA